MDLNDNISDALIQSMAGKIPRAFDLAWKCGQDLYKRSRYEDAARQYRDSIVQDYGTMQILGMERPVPLKQIYTEVRLAAKIAARQFASMDELVREARSRLKASGIELIAEQARSQLIEEIRGEELGSMIRGLEQAHELEATAAHDEVRGARVTLRISRASAHSLQRRVDARAARSRELIARISEEESAAANARSVIRNAQERIKKIAQHKKQAIQDAVTHIKSRQLQPAEALEVESKLAERVERLLNERAESLIKKDILRAQVEEIGHNGTEEDAWAAVISRPRVMILGRPGAGKTTFLKHAVLRALIDDDSQDRLPVFVSLRELALRDAVDLLEYSVQELEAAGFSDSKQYLERLLRKKDVCMVLLDGLDEVPLNRRDAVIQEIARFSRKFRQAQIVVSCRTANYRGQLPGFVELEIVDFDHRQVARFVEGWFRPESERAASFLKELHRRSHLMDLTATPLLLAILCIAYKRTGRFPERRAALYHSCIDALLVDWDSSRQVHRDSYVQGLDSESKKLLLAKVACDLYCEGSLVFERDSLISRLDAIAQGCGFPPRVGVGVLTEVVRNHGLIVERAQGVFSFSHLTIHEFLCAYHISRNCRAEVFQSVVDELWRDVSWRDTVLFLGGLLTDAGALVAALVTSAKRRLYSIEGAAESLGFGTPQLLDAFLADGKSSGSPRSWVAWLRACMLSTLVSHGRVAGTGGETLPNRIEAISGLARKNAKPAESKAVHKLLRESLDSLAVDYVRGVSGGKVQEGLSRYLGVADVVLTIIAEGGLVSREMVEWAMTELFHAQETQAPSPQDGYVNKLGI